MNLPKAPKKQCGVHTLPSREERCVSELIAALFLIMIAVTLGTAIYLFVMGKGFEITSSIILFKSSYMERTAERLVPLVSAYSASDNTVHIVIFNCGEVPVKIKTAYAGLDPSNVTPVALIEEPLLLPDRTVEVNISLPFTPPPGSTVYVILVTERGNRVLAKASA